MTIKQPVGVVAAISPWNFPACLGVQACAPAIVAGCTVVHKPAQDTPLTSLALAYLAEKAGLPPGVLNVLTCENPTAVGEELSTNPLVNKLTFTGSTAVGKLLASQAASTVKRVSLELGGNCPFLIFADANLEDAIEKAFMTKFYNAGQVCNGINRFLVEDSIYDEVVEKFTQKAKTLKLGSGRNPMTTLGPVINQAAVRKVQRLVDEAQKKGAILVMGGTAESLLYEPTILKDVPTNAALYHEEIFGPVAAFYRFKTEKEAIHMANDTVYGLAAYVFTNNFERIRRLSAALEAGSVGINTTGIFREMAPFGGFKQSGIGREGGVVGSLDHYYEVKAITLGAGNVPEK